MVKLRHPERTPRIQDIRFAHPNGPSCHVEIVRVSTLRKRAMPHSIYDHTRRNFHVLQFIVDGRGKHIVDFEPVKLRAGNVLHLRPGQVHAFDETSSHEALMAVFLPEALARPHQLDRLDAHRPTVLKPPAKDFSLLVDLVKTIEDLPNRGVQLRAQELAPPLLAAIVAAIEHLVDAHDASKAVATGMASTVRQFERLLEQRQDTRRSVAWYATELQVSHRTLARACDAVLGTAPKKYIDARLGLEAKRHLIFSSHSIEEVSRSLGFTEATNFVKFFRRITGLTPQEFRRRMLNKTPA